MKTSLQKCTFRYDFFSGEDTKRSLAKLTGNTPKTIAEWATGTSIPNLENMLKIAEYKGSNISYFLSLTDVNMPLDSYSVSTEKMRLKELRQKAGYSKEAFAKLAGVTPLTLTKYEEQGPLLRLSTTLSFAEALHVSPEYILGLTNYKTWDEANLSSYENLKLTPSSVYLVKEKEIAYYAMTTSAGKTFLSNGESVDTKEFEEKIRSDISQKTSSIELVDGLETRRKKLEEEIYSLAGCVFNIDNFEEIASVLKTKTKRVTMKDLEMLSETDPLAAKICEYKYFEKSDDNTSQFNRR